MRNIADLIGRIFLSCIFIFEAYDSLAHVGRTKEQMTEYGITWNQDFLFNGSICFLIMGGLMLLFGYRSTLGAFLLFLYFAPLTFIMHDFWNEPKATLRFESILFMKNIAILGGLLIVVANGSGRFSVKKLFATTRV